MWKRLNQLHEVEKLIITCKLLLIAKLVLPRVNQKVKYLPSGGDAWKEALILSRAGKVTGKY